MDKQLYIREIHEDYRVKDPNTFIKSHVAHIKKMQHAPIEDEEGNTEVKRVKVKSISNEKFVQDEGQWLFSCDMKVKVFK